MLSRYGLLIFFLALFTSKASAQFRQKERGVKLESINAIGILNGSARTAVLLQTILGVSMHHSFAGIGTGLDFYRFRSVPLFVDLRHEFGTSNRLPFVYADLGNHFDWLSDANKQNQYNFTVSNDYSGGLYYDVGAGYAIHLKTKDAILLSAGYSFKHLESKSAGSYFCPVAGECPTTDTYNYALRRLAIKAAFAF